MFPVTGFPNRKYVAILASFLEPVKLSFATDVSTKNSYTVSSLTSYQIPIVGSESIV